MFVHRPIAESKSEAPSAERRAPRLRFFVLLLLLTLASGSAVAVGFGLTKWSRTKATAKETLSNNPAEDAPRHVGPLAPVLFGKDSDEAVCVQRLLRSPQPGPRNLPYCCHLLRLYGWGSMPGPHFTSGREVLAALTDRTASERYFGEPAFFQTRSGIRYRTLEVASANGAENHRDICLATFAEAGLPLSTEFTTPKETFHLRDLLRDSVQNFHLQQKELPWTAIAYSLYPSVGPRWTNRFGESFGWDDLTEALLAAPLERGSCGGTHLLYALTSEGDFSRWRCPERDGVNCLYLQLCLLGYKGTYEEVVSVVPGSAEQASLGGLAQAARRLGFALVSAKMTVAELSNLRSPVVVLLEDAELGHGRFHLLLGFSASKVHLVDGGFNTRFGMMPIDRFRHGWTGFALVPRSASFWPGRAFGTALGAVTVGVAVWFARRAGRERQRRASTPPGGMTPFSPEAV